MKKLKQLFYAGVTLMLCMVFSTDMSAQQGKFFPKEGQRLINILAPQLNLSETQKTELQALWVESRVISDRSQLKEMSLEERKDLRRQRGERFMELSQSVLSEEQYAKLTTLAQFQN